MVEKSRWETMVTENPDHSRWFVERFRAKAAAGEDVSGEARLVDALVPRAARILDAGCGSGRLAPHLLAQGHTVVGVDVDPVLIEAARADHPGGTWIVGDLAELDLPAAGVPAGFDAIVAAGNVMPFLAPSTRVGVLSRLRDHLAPGGRIATGFGAGRGYLIEDFLTDVGAAGLDVESRYESWDLRPFTPESGFLVAVLTRGRSGRPR
ncbi:trans-aconitate 2-methyltransferase [Pseudactinotalea sp. HY158]|uniref:class I SAM-dependent methyltransferase n=1 Tax=Pseudactinotalea sp. HY158 TaxID=2654547 RepID=UPI00129C1B87|nr:class I SAM-dependent methyltransferase [Pseudactinotalea sp. HY158]QGH70728.1 methyltransferase domain-containing protein [Pseudactinotalea sp. HY158]